MARFRPDEFELVGGREDNVADDPIDETNFTIGQPPIVDPQWPAGTLSGNMQQEMIKTTVNDFYNAIAARGDTPSLGRDYSKFTLDSDGKLKLIAYPDLQLVRLDNGKPLALTSISSNIRKELGFIDWKKKPSRLSKKASAALNEVGQVSEHAENVELRELPQAATRVSEAMERALSVAGAERSTTDESPLPLRELLSLDKLLQSIRGAMVNNRAKREAVRQEIEHRERKVREAPNEEARKFQEERLKNLRDDAEGLDTEYDIFRGKLKNQIVQIRETITKVLSEDTTLGEKLRTLFREQGVTLVSIITALGMAISALVLAITRGTSSALPPPEPPRPTPPDKGGIKEWAKQRLQDLGRLLGKLAEKAAAALPGIIGSIVSWLLSTAQKAVGWLAENLWALVVGIGGMVFLTAKDYIAAKQMRLATSRAPPKKE